MQYYNYFDDNGNLIAFIRECSFFNGRCADIVRERSCYYYSTKQYQHDLIKKTYEIVDGDFKPLNYESCDIGYRYDYKIYTTLTEYLKYHKFEK